MSFQFKLRHTAKHQHRHHLKQDFDYDSYNPANNPEFTRKKQYVDDFGPNDPIMQDDTFQNGNHQYDYLFDINSEKEYEENFEMDYTNRYWNNLQKKDEEFWHKHEKQLSTPVNYH